MTSITIQETLGGPIAKGLALMTVVVGAVMVLNGNSKRRTWGIVLLIAGLLVLAVNLLWWFLGAAASQQTVADLTGILLSVHAALCMYT